jgi:CRP-like cAMP-binding protein
MFFFVFLTFFVSLYKEPGMFEVLFSNIRQKIQITEKEEEICRSLFIPKKLRKRQYLLQQGDVSKYTAFVEKGLLRSYVIDDKGSELIMQFAPEGWWIGDMYSNITGEPAENNIDAIEDSELLLLTNQGYDQLLQEAPVFEKLFRLLLQNSFIALQRRLKGNIIQTAEEKYKDFIKLYPNIAQRVPQHNIASFLGITPESLSRIRKQMAER